MISHKYAQAVRYYMQINYMQMTQIYCINLKNDISKIQTSLQFDFNHILKHGSILISFYLIIKKKSCSIFFLFLFFIFFATRSALHKQNNSFEVK